MQTLTDSLQASKQQAVTAEAQSAQLKTDLADAQAAAQEAEQAAKSAKSKLQAAEKRLQSEKESLQVLLRPPVAEMSLKCPGGLWAAPAMQGPCKETKRH